MVNNEPVTHGEANPHAGAAQRIRVLIADDSAPFREAVGQFLERLTRVEVVGAATDGEHALALVANTRPDLVLMDLQMPRLNGLQATRKIRHEFPGVRVILVSIHDFGSWTDAGAMSGADRFIPKHALHDELAGAIAQLFPDRDGGAGRAQP